jgi:hypothetical protein
VNGFGLEAGKPLASSNRTAKIAFTGRREPRAVRADFLVELRGFEPLLSAVQAPARLTGPPLPVLQGLIADARLWIPRRRRGRWRSGSLGAQLATGDLTVAGREGGGLIYAHSRSGARFKAR